jgi:hypothetical protein
LLERKAFRMMRKYYKERFDSWMNSKDYKKNLPSMSADEINYHVIKFMKHELGSILRIISEEDLVGIRNGLKTIIFCDRHKKIERITEGLNFSLLRNVLHRYNSTNMSNFLSHPSFAFLYTHFFLKNGKKASEEQQEVNHEKLIHSMYNLMKKTLYYLPEKTTSLFQKVYLSIYC